MWHWVVQFPNQHVHNYSGKAKSLEQANTDLVLSAEHFIFTQKPHSL